MGDPHEIHERRRFRLALMAVSLLVLAAVGWYLRGSMRLGYIDSAIGSVRALVNEEERFSETHPNRGYACSISELDANRLPQRLGKTGYRNGYTFELTCPNAGTGSTGRNFQVIARPVGSGMPTFCSDQSGIVKYVQEAPASACLTTGSHL